MSRTAIVNRTTENYHFSSKFETPLDPKKPSSYQLYITECTRLKCNPNSVFVDELPKAPGVYTMRDVNCANNYIGDVGLMAILPVMAANKEIQRIRIPNNGLKNESVLALIKMIEIEFPNLVSLDLSRNKSLSLDVGVRIAKLAKERKSLQRVILVGTSVSNPLQKDIDGFCQANRRDSSEEVQLQLNQRKRISRKQFLDIKYLFDKLDTDETGKLTIDELRKAAALSKSFAKGQTAEGAYWDGVLSTDEHAYLELLLTDLGSLDGTLTVTFLEYLMKCFPAMEKDNLLFCIQCYSEYEQVELSVAPSLSAQQLQELQTLFRRYDKNKDGFVSYEEMSVGLAHIGWMDKKTFASVQPGPNGLLSLQNFITEMTPYYTS